MWERALAESEADADSVEMESASLNASLFWETEVEGSSLAKKISRVARNFHSSREMPQKTLLA